MVRLSFTVTEYDPAKRWIVRTIDHRTVELDGAADFSAWAREQWPDQRFTVQPDPRLEPWSP